MVTAGHTEVKPCLTTAMDRLQCLGIVLYGFAAITGTFQATIKRAATPQDAATNPCDLPHHGVQQLERNYRGELVQYGVKMYSPSLVTSILVHTACSDKELRNHGNITLLYVHPSDPSKLLRTYGEFPGNSTELRLHDAVYMSYYRLAPTAPKPKWCYNFFDYRGCDAPTMCPPDWCMNGGSCDGNFTCACAPEFVGTRCEERFSNVTVDNCDFLSEANGIIETPCGDYIMEGLGSDGENITVDDEDDNQNAWQTGGSWPANGNIAPGSAWSKQGSGQTGAFTNGFNSNIKWNSGRSISKRGHSHHKSCHLRGKKSHSKHHKKHHSHHHSHHHKNSDKSHSCHGDFSKHHYNSKHNRHYHKHHGCTHKSKHKHHKHHNHHKTHSIYNTIKNGHIDNDVEGSHLYYKYGMLNMIVHTGCGEKYKCRCRYDPNDGQFHDIQTSFSFKYGCEIHVDGHMCDSHTRPHNTGYSTSEPPESLCMGNCGMPEPTVPTGIDVTSMQHVHVGTHLTHLISTNNIGLLIPPPLPAPVTTTQKPVTTTKQPTTTTKQPVTTTKQPVTTTKQPVTTTKQPVTTTKQPVTTTKQPVTTTKQPVTTTKQPVTTTKQPVTTTKQPVTTTKQPVTTTKQPVTTTKQPVTTTKQPVTTTKQPVTTTKQPVTTTKQPVTTTKQPVTTTKQPVTTTKQPVTTTKQPVTTTKQPVTTTKQPVTTTKQPVTTTKQPVTTTKQPVTTTKQPVTTTKQQVTTTKQPVTTTKQPVTTTKQPVTTTTQPVTTTKQPVTTTTQPVTTTKQPVTTTKQPVTIPCFDAMGSKYCSKTGICTDPFAQHYDCQKSCGGCGKGWIG